MASTDLPDFGAEAPTQNVLDSEGCFSAVRPFRCRGFPYPPGQPAFWEMPVLTHDRLPAGFTYGHIDLRDSLSAHIPECRFACRSVPVLHEKLHASDRQKAPRP